MSACYCVSNKPARLGMTNLKLKILSSHTHLLLQIRKLWQAQWRPTACETSPPPEPWSLWRIPHWSPPGSIRRWAQTCWWGGISCRCSAPSRWIWKSLRKTTVKSLECPFFYREKLGCLMGWGRIHTTPFKPVIKRYLICMSVSMK